MKVEEPTDNQFHPTIHRMTRRLNGWDYCAPSIYLITITLADRRSQALGRVVVTRSGSPEEVAAEFEPSDLGKAILAHWKRISEFTPEIKPLYCRLMPDHLHAILRVTRPMKRPLGQAIAGFKTGCEKIYRQLALSAQDKSREPAKQLSTRGKLAAKQLEGGVAACSVSSTPVDELPRLFDEGFQDSILFHAGQLDNMFAYLADNPRRLAIKRLYPDLFKSVSSLSIPLPGLGENAIGHFAALGNRFLLRRSLAQVQVSRRLFAYKRIAKPGGGTKIARDEHGEPIVEFSSREFTEKKTELLDKAKRGAVLLSPCVSDGERQIAHEALKEGHPLITLQNKGFSPLQKPGGRYFDACAEGRLLMLAPAAWPYTPAEKPMTRFDATAMNRLGQLIAGEGAAQINYHGMTPTNIDSLAMEAAQVILK